MCRKLHMEELGGARLGKKRTSAPERAPARSSENVPSGLSQSQVGGSSLLGASVISAAAAT